MRAVSGWLTFNARICNKKQNLITWVYYSIFICLKDRSLLHISSKVDSDKYKQSHAASTLEFLLLLSALSIHSKDYSFFSRKDRETVIQSTLIPQFICP